jgi:uncharacterized integral membrane protein (TIGR00697 family)
VNQGEPTLRAREDPAPSLRTSGAGAASRAGIVVIASYIAAQILADVGSLKIVLLFGLVVDAGTLVYPLTFTLRDLVHKVVGREGARMLVILAGIVNLAMAAYFALVARLPAAPAAGLQPDFGSVLAPVWRIVIASILAEVVSELLDTEVYHVWVTRVTRRHQWLRVLISNGVSAPIDSAIFVLLAFGNVYPINAVLSIILANIVLKYGVTILSLPLIYLVPASSDQD